MKKLLTIFVFAASFAAASPNYTTTVTATTVTAADCAAPIPLNCHPGIVINMNTQDPRAVAFWVVITYFENGIPRYQAKVVSIDSPEPSVEFFFPNLSAVTLKSAAAYVLISPGEDQPGTYLAP